MSKIEYINIPVDLSEEVERRFFEYNAALSVCRYLMSQEGIQESMMQKYLDSVECKWVDLEMMKNEVTAAYPSKLGNSHYEFDFHEHCIKYTAEEPVNG